jgi:hypothetical protein
MTHNSMPAVLTRLGVQACLLSEEAHSRLDVFAFAFVSRDVCARACVCLCVDFLLVEVVSLLLHMTGCVVCCWFFVRKVL